MDTFGCVDNTIKVFSGQYLDLLNPSPEMIDLKSIAHALANTCRFGGHCPRFYSVAEHSIHAASLATDKYRVAVLLHDAAEAYIGDIVKPLKLLLPDLRLIEHRIDLAIRHRFALTDYDHVEIKRCDQLMLKAEKVHFWPDDLEQWEGFAGLEMPDVQIIEYGPDEAERRFMDAYSSACHCGKGI